MKKLLIALVILMTSSLIFAEGIYKYLHYRFNPNVLITISNIDCPLPELKDKYPLAAVATRIDGERLLACYTHEGDDIIIQWYKGDTSRFPANVFLILPEQDKTYKQKPNV